MITKEQVMELQGHNCDHSGPCSEIPFCADAVGVYLMDIETLLRENEALRRVAEAAKRLLSVDHGCKDPI